MSNAISTTCTLALEDGSIFGGFAFGARGTRCGEVVFNTAHTGYQEIFTDPSYSGQIVVMTFPLMGNYGVNSEDQESERPFLAGFVVREAIERPSNFRATASMHEFLQGHDIIGLSGIDTRALTRRLRVEGAMRGALSTEIMSEPELVRLARDAAPMSGANLVGGVSPRAAAGWSAPLSAYESAAISPASGPVRHIVAVDCGIKHNILRHLSQQGFRVTRVPADASAGQILDLAPDGVLFGNGPGDPAAVVDTIHTLRALLGRVPIFGICLGHQLLGLALGAQTYKLRFGHHGTNTPVLNVPAGRVEITSQNHGFAVDAASLARVGGVVTHVNLNDQSLEGFVHPDLRCMAVQFHPEASPGPHDAAYLFRRFGLAVQRGLPLDAELLQVAG